MEAEKDNKNTLISAYDEQADKIFRYCFFRVFDRERAKELMQETFMKTWEYMEKGNKIDNMRAFLYKVAHNLCVNSIARPSQFSLDSMNEQASFDIEDDNVCSPESEAEISLLMSKMRELKNSDREILAMRYVDDMAVSEIAETLGMLPNTVSVRIKRAEEALKKLYK